MTGTNMHHRIFTFPEDQPRPQSFVSVCLRDSVQGIREHLWFDVRQCPTRQARRLWLSCLHKAICKHHLCSNPIVKELVIINSCAAVCKDSSHESSQRGLFIVLSKRGHQCTRLRGSALSIGPIAPYTLRRTIKFCKKQLPSYVYFL